MKPGVTNSPRVGIGKRTLYERVKRTLLCQILFSFLGGMGMVTEDISWPMWPLWLGPLITIPSLAFFLYSSFILRRAYLLQITYSILYFSCLLPITYAMAALISNPLLVFLILLFCFVFMFIRVTITFRGLVNSSVINQRSGCLNIRDGIWDISKPMVTKGDSSSTRKKWMTYIPIAASLGSIIGNFFYHHFSEFSWLILSSIYLILGFSIISILAREFAIGLYLKQVEEKSGKRILVKI